MSCFLSVSVESGDEGRTVCDPTAPSLGFPLCEW
jgi:hypothetical protein